MHNFRCRSAFKLLEINDRVKILKPGQCVIDCGAAPGSWTQVAVTKTNADGKRNQPVGTVISIDKLSIHPIKGAEILGNMDFTTPEAINKLNETLDGRTVDVVLSDMAPNAAGIKSMDHDRIISLAYSALGFAVQVSAVGASIVLKIWDGGSTPELRKDMVPYYKSVRFIKPKASYKDSSEVYLIGKDFKGVKT